MNLVPETNLELKKSTKKNLSDVEELYNEFVSNFSNKENEIKIKAININKEITENYEILVKILKDQQQKLLDENALLVKGFLQNLNAITLDMKVFDCKAKSKEIDQCGKEGLESLKTELGTRKLEIETKLNSIKNLNNSKIEFSKNKISSEYFVKSKLIGDLFYNQSKSKQMEENIFSSSFAQLLASQSHPMSKKRVSNI